MNLVICTDCHTQVPGEGEIDSIVPHDQTIFLKLHLRGVIVIHRRGVDNETTVVHGRVLSLFAMQMTKADELCAAFDVFTALSSALMLQGGQMNHCALRVCGKTSRTAIFSVGGSGGDVYLCAPSMPVMEGFVSAPISRLLDNDEL